MQFAIYALAVEPAHDSLHWPARAGGKVGFSMRRITIRSVAGLGMVGLSLAVALCLVTPCHAQNLQQIDKNGIAIVNSSPSYPSGGDWGPQNVLDLTTSSTNPFPTAVPNQFVTDYASAGAGTSTFIIFDLGAQYTLSAILFTDRTTSGAGNGAFKGGTSDFCTSYMFTFSNDVTFATNVGTLTVNVPVPSQPTTLESFQTLSIITGVPPVEYVMWQVLANNGSNNNGAADFAFFGQ